MLEIADLKKLNELTESDMILVSTSEGVKAIPSVTLGAAVSPVTLYERFAKSISSVFNTEKVSTSNKVQRYLLKDTSKEVYMELDKNNIIWYESEVYTVDKVPQIQQYTDMSGNLVYWSEDPDSSEFSGDGYPWKVQSGRKIFMTYEKTQFPVLCYKYTTKTIKKSTISDSGMVDEYTFGNRQTGVIKKTNKEFIFSMSIGSKECGMRVVVDDTTGEISGELIGTWEGVNDIDPDKRLTKDSVKKFLYEDQDLNSYLISIVLDTSNKIGWYLSEDTSNKVFSYVKDGYLVIRQAVVKQNPTTGNPITQHAKNLYGNLLYWKEDMSVGGAVSSAGYPLKNGINAFLTTEKTDYPAYIYDYNYTDLLKLSYSPQNGIEQEFKDASGNSGKISLLDSEFVAKFKNSSGTKETSITMNADSGVLKGAWKVDNDSSIFDITPEKVGTYTIISGDEVTVTLENNKTFLLQHTGTTQLNIQIPEAEEGTVIHSKIFVPNTDILITWGSNIVGTDTEKTLNESGTTEFVLTHYKGLNELIYLKKL